MIGGKLLEIWLRYSILRSVICENTKNNGISVLFLSWSHCSGTNTLWLQEIDLKNHRWGHYFICG